MILNPAIQAAMKAAQDKASPNTMSAADAKMNALFQQQLSVNKRLRNAGVPERLIPYATAMIFLETAQFTSPLVQDNNFSGIKYVRQPGATAGRPAPKSEGGGNYAKYANPDTWARDFVRILSLNRSGQGKPIDATNGSMFYARLKANGYYGITYDQYRTRANAWIAKLNKAKEWYKGYHKTHGYPETVNAGDWTVADDRAAAEQQKKVEEAETITANMKKHWKWWLLGGLGTVVLIRVLK